MASSNNQQENSVLEEIRNKYRQEQLAHREHQRRFLLRKARYSNEDSSLCDYSEKDIKTLGEKIKTKSQVTPELLSAIMNNLLESVDNVSLFLSVDGALQALLRELSGQNEKHQLIAARCIGNLALGSEKESLQVLKAAESYLMVHLSGKNYYIIEACLIAIGNFGHQDVKHIELIQKQGFIPKIIELLDSFDLSVQESAVYALTQIIYSGYDILKLETLEKCLRAVIPIFKKSPTSHLAFLVFLLTSNKSLCEIILKDCIHSQTLQLLSDSLKKENNESLHYLRILNNCVCEESGQLAGDLIQNYGIVLKECINFILHKKQEHLQKECLGFVGNLYNHPTEIFKGFVIEVLKENSKQIEAIVRFLKTLPDNQFYHSRQLKNFNFQHFQISRKY